MKKLYNKSYFRVPMQNLIKLFNPKIAKKLDNPIYLLLAYIILFLVGVFLWGLLFGVLSTFAIIFEYTVLNKYFWIVIIVSVGLSTCIGFLKKNR